MNDERLRQLYQGVAVHATADLEHMAALELLVLVMLADHHVDVAEVDTIRSISEEWRGGVFSFEQYLGPAVARAREAVEHDAVEALLDDIDHRVASTVLRAALFSAARDVAGADHRVDLDEESLLGQIAARFD